MSRPPTKTPRLGDRDYEIFEHLTRYHITTREVLRRLFFSDSEENAVTKVTSRLTLHGYLNRYELYPPRTYFVVGPRPLPCLHGCMVATMQPRWRADMMGGEREGVEAG